MHRRVNYFCMFFAIASLATTCVLFVKLHTLKHNTKQDIINPQSLEKLYTAISNIQTYYHETVNTDELIDNTIETLVKNLDKHSKILFRDNTDIEDSNNTKEISSLEPSAYPNQNEKNLNPKKQLSLGLLKDSSIFNIYYKNTKNILYIKCPIFIQGATNYIKNILRQYPSNYPTILDLRDNPGGIVQEGLDLVKLFVSSGQIINIKDKNPQIYYDTYAKENYYIHRGPLVILINRNSASTTELVAGSLKKSQRALIVGEQSYGKSSIQTILPLGSSNDLMKLTTGEFTFVDGSSINNIGIVPDIKIGNSSTASAKLKDRQLHFAYKIIEKYYERQNINHD